MLMDRILVNFYDNFEHSLNIYKLTSDYVVGVVQVLIGDDSAWKNNGSLGNEWKKVTIPLQYQPHPFRVIYLIFFFFCQSKTRIVFAHYYLP